MQTTKTLQPKQSLLKRYWILSIASVFSMIWKPSSRSRNPLRVKTSRTKNAIEDWQQLKDKDYYDWQELILTYGAASELESNNWLEDTLLLSMDKNLCSEVASDMSGFLPIKRRAVTMLRCIIKRMVVKN